MQHSVFKSTIAAMMNRTTTALTINSVDLITQVANSARRHAQRILDFGLLECSVDLTVNLTSGVEMSTAVLHGTATAAVINRIRRAYVQDGSTYRPVRFATRAEQHRVLEAAWDRTLPWTSALPTDNVVQVSEIPMVARLGTKIFVYPSSSSLWGSSTTSVSVGLDVIKWADDVTTDGTEDFFLAYCPDWLINRTVRDLSNLVLKDRERTLVTQAQLNESWAAVVAWNSSITDGETMTTLD